MQIESILLEVQAVHLIWTPATLAYTSPLLISAKILMFETERQDRNLGSSMCSAC